jgi:uncharacterized protein (TIGR04255 family)
MQFGLGIPLARLWSASEDQQWLVQSQDDRLTFNWRRVPGGPLYPGFELLNELFSDLLTQLEPAAVPSVAEFTYVNDVAVDFARLHETYTIFQERDDNAPGRAVDLRLQETRQLDTEGGLGLVTTSIEPIRLSQAMTRLTISAKVFASSEPSLPLSQLLAAAHNVAKLTFYAVVSEDARDRWGESK